MINYRGNSVLIHRNFKEQETEQGKSMPRKWPQRWYAKTHSEDAARQHQPCTSEHCDPSIVSDRKGKRGRESMWSLCGSTACSLPARHAPQESCCRLQSTKLQQLLLQSSAILTAYWPQLGHVQTIHFITDWRNTNYIMHHEVSCAYWWTKWGKNT